MVLNLELPEEIEHRLERTARERGLPVNDLALKLLDEHLPPTDKAKAAIALLQSWIDADEADAEEQRATGEFLIQALDEDRPSGRKLFPPELKGITW